VKKLLLTLFAVGSLMASEHRGVVKYSGLPVPGVSVTATLGDKKLSVVTDPAGVYDFADLADGVWKIRVEMLCFEPIEKEIAVAANAPAAEWELKLLPFEQIKASAPPAPPVSAAPATQTAPSAAQSTPAAAAATPEGKPSIVAANKKNAGKNGKPQPQVANTSSGFQRAEVNASGNGARPPAADGQASNTTEANQAPSDGFLINGSVNNGANTPFAQNAAFGNNRRGLRSLYNGNVGLTMDNAVWDAQQYSITGQATPKPSYNRMTGLLAFGGPVRIPRVWIRNTPNFFVNYQWNRGNNVNTVPGLMPTLAERSGDLTALGVKLVDPTTGTPIPTSVIPGNLISKQAIALMSLYPLPNFTGSTRYNYQVPVAQSTHQDSMQARMNKSIKRRDNVSGIFAFQSTRSDNVSNSIFGFNDTNRSLGINTNLNWMHRISQRMFMTTTLNYSRQAIRLTPFFAFRQNVSGDAGITGNNQDPANWGPPSLSFASGVSGLGDGQSSFTRNQQASISENFFWNHGAHNVTVVGDIRRNQYNLISQQNPRGAFQFTGQAVGNDFAGFLLGIPDGSSIAFGNADKYFRASSYDVGFTDDWRVSPSLTINAGLRWDYSTPVVEQYGRLVNLDIASGFGAVAPVVANKPTGPLTGASYADSLVNPDRHAFQPRVGLSWRPFMASSMVVRAGYGVNYDTNVYFPIAARMAQQSPLSKSLAIQNSLANPLTLANGFNAPPNQLTNTFAVDPNLHIGYVQSWQVSVQRDLPGSLVMTANYLGIKGTHAMQQILPNTYPLGAANPCPSCPTGFAYLLSGGNSIRNAGTVMIRRRLHNGFTGSVNYTYSKSIDDAALGGQGQAGSTLIAQNWLDLRAERALSNFDQRHLVTLNGQYTSGMGLKGGTLLGGWKGPLLKDWTFASDLTMGSGRPLNPVYTALTAGTGVAGTIRPDVTGLSLYDAPAGLFLNPAAFAKPASGHWGNAGRNTITGPRQFVMNASMARTFRMSDRLNTDVRFQATNVLNHVTYPSWIANINSLQFGLPGTANQMRTLQATVRLRF
jgi:hypothetical protein